MNNASADTARCANNGMSGHGTLPSRADDVCWQLTHYHHHHVIQKAAYSQNATGENNQIAGVCGISVLARLFDSGHHRQVDQWPGITASSTCTVLIEAVNGTQ